MATHYAALQVLEWHRRFKVNIGTDICIPDIDRRELRKTLCREEVEELCAALDAKDIIEVADALADLLFVVYGTAVECGLYMVIGNLFDEVHRSNMSKLDENGEPIIRADGKILKGSNFTPPALAPILGITRFKHKNQNNENKENSHKEDVWSNTTGNI